MATPILGVRYYATKAGTWEAPGRPSLLPAAPVFEVGTTVPDETTVGAGLLRSLTSVVNSDVTYSTPTAPGHPIADVTFNGTVKAVPGVEFENCAMRGPAVRTTGSNLLQVIGYEGAGSAQVLARYCDFNPQGPSSYWNGVGFRNYRLEQCNIWGSTDGLAAYALAGDSDKAVHIDVIGTWIHDLAQFKPDVAGNRDVTHNDCIQCQGNVGPADDIFLDGCRLDGYHSATQGSPLPPEHTQISAVMITPAASTQDRICLTVMRSWLSGGIDTFNATKTGQPNTVIVLDSNTWEKPHPSTGGPSLAIAISSAITNRTVTRQLYTDGTAVPVTLTA